MFNIFRLFKSPKSNWVKISGEQGYGIYDHNLKLVDSYCTGNTKWAYGIGQEELESPYIRKHYRIRYLTEKEVYQLKAKGL